MPRTIVLDTNLLILLVVGSTNKQFIRLHKRTKAFTVEDFDLLVREFKGIDRMVVTPNTLTEASNLLRQIAEPARSQITAAFKALIEHQEEVYIKSSDASSRLESSDLVCRTTLCWK
jgi:hypothetical protein